MAHEVVLFFVSVLTETPSPLPLLCEDIKFIFGVNRELNYLLTWAARVECLRDAWLGVDKEPPH